MPKDHTLSRSKADRHFLYQASVQNADYEVDFAARQYLRRHGKRARILREDFCGTAAIACRWVKNHPERYAIGLDLDADTLDWARKHNLKQLRVRDRARVDLRLKDVRSVTSPKADIIPIFNFSSYLFHPVSELIKYFRCVRHSLTAGGVIMLDAYGGWEAQRRITERRTVKSTVGTFGYVWEQARFNPIDNRALCYIHFEFKGGHKWKRAFTYDWRVYSPVELRDALEASGFSRIEVLWNVSTDPRTDNFRPVSHTENTSAWLAYIIAESPV